MSTHAIRTPASLLYGFTLQLLLIFFCGFIFAFLILLFHRQTRQNIITGLNNNKNSLMIRLLMIVIRSVVLVRIIVCRGRLIKLISYYVSCWIS
jgi:hypothetical protein